MKVKEEEKILVLATTQKNAMKLIEYGFSLALACKGELHILHVQKGNSVFDGTDTLRMLQELVDYGGRLGACVHVYCADDVSNCVGKFVREKNMTRVVLGEGSKEKKKKQWNEKEYILNALPKTTEVHVVSKEAMAREAMIS